MTNDMYAKRKGKTAVIYVRVSLEKQTENYSLEAQQRYLEEWAKHEGMAILKVYIEAGRSGKSVAGRETFQQMLDDIASGVVRPNYVLVFKLSRFARNVKDLLVSLEFLRRYGTELISQQEGVDSSTTMGRMMVTFSGAVAEMERENILSQTMLGREQKAHDGGWNGGPAPYGYRLINGSLVINEDEAKVVTYVFEQYTNVGLGYSAIASHLNRQGVPRPLIIPANSNDFVDWSFQHIKRMLSNPIYTGKIAFGKSRQQKIEGTENEFRRVKRHDFILSDNIAHEPIVSQETYEKAQEIMHDRGITMAPKVGCQPKHFLTGILKCPQCGSSMYSNTIGWKVKDGTRHKKFQYQCGHTAKSPNGKCKKNAIDAEWVESEVIGYTKELVCNEVFAEDIQQKIGVKIDVAELDEEIEAYQARLRRLERSKSNLERDIDSIEDDDENGERKRKDMNRRLDGLYREIGAVEREIADCQKKKTASEQSTLTKEGVFKMLSTFDEFFNIMDDADKCTLMKTLISEVHLYPKSTWQEGRNPIKSITYTFPIGNALIESMGENSTGVCCAVKPSSLLASRCKLVRS